MKPRTFIITRLYMSKYRTKRLQRRQSQFRKTAIFIGYQLQNWQDQIIIILVLPKGLVENLIKVWTCEYSSAFGPLPFTEKTKLTFKFLGKGQRFYIWTEHLTLRTIKVQTEFYANVEMLKVTSFWFALHIQANKHLAGEGRAFHLWTCKKKKTYRATIYIIVGRKLF